MLVDPRHEGQPWFFSPQERVKLQSGKFDSRCSNVALSEQRREFERKSQGDKEKGSETNQVRGDHR
jgi:hypothetical protein